MKKKITKWKVILHSSKNLQKTFKKKKKICRSLYIKKRKGFRAEKGRGYHLASERCSQVIMHTCCEPIDLHNRSRF